MRILIHRLGSLGDTVVALPCFKLIRLRYPHAHIAVLTNSPVSNKAAPLESIVENMGLIDGVLAYPMATRDYDALSKLHAEIKEGQYDLLISLSIGRTFLSTIRDYFYFKTCGISRIIGLPWSRRDRVCLKVGGGPDYELEALRLLRRIRGLGPGVRAVDPQEPGWTNLKLTKQELVEGDRILAENNLDDFVVCSLGTKSPLKDWGTENWCSLFEKLSASFQHLTLVMLGSPDESERSDVVRKHWKGPTVNLCGMASPRVSSAILAKSSLFMGHDSGPGHLAGAAGTRCITIYSCYAPPGQWFVLGKGHVPFYPYKFYDAAKWNDPMHQKSAISSITVDEVYAAAKKCLIEK